jgi:hypothetical protein
MICLFSVEYTRLSLNKAIPVMGNKGALYNVFR